MERRPRRGAAPERLGWPTLLAYGGLALPLAALNLPLYVYLPTFYAAERGLALSTIGAALFTARLVDLVVDPVLGELADRSRGRFGQRRPWILVAAPLLLLSTWYLFVPPEGAGGTHLLVWSVLGYLAWTAILLSYTAWGVELTADYHERTRVTAVREGWIIAGVLLAAGLPAATGLPPDSGGALGLVFLVMLVALPTAIVALVAAVPERDPPEGRPLGLAEGLLLVARNRPFRRLVLAFLVNGVANGLPATLFILFAQNVIGAGAWTGTFLLLYFVSGMLAIPLWTALSYRLGKHRAWSYAMLWSAAVFAWVPLLGPGDLVLFGLVCVLSGLSLGADLALPASMQADVIDLDRVRSGRRRTALFMALWSMATKLALALAVGIAFPVLDLVAFVPGSGGEAGSFALRGLYALLPALLKLVAVALVWRFELDAGEQERLRRSLEGVV